MKENLLKHKKTLIVAAVLLGAALLFAAVFVILYLVNPAQPSIDSAVISDDSIAIFKDDVKIAMPNDNLTHRFKEVTLNEKGEYTLHYSKNLPDFFSSLSIGDMFCVYPNAEEKKSYFSKGFCGKIIEKSDENATITFTIPQIYEIFNKLKIDTTSGEPESIAFYPDSKVESFSSVPMQSGLLSATNDAVFSIGNADIDFKYKKNDLAPVKPDYQILCEQLKIKIKYNVNSEYSIDGSITLDYPSLKFLLDYEYDEQSEEILINDYGIDFVTKEKINLAFKGKKEFTPLKNDEDLLDIISPVDIVDVTESESGKFVLGTYVIGYNVKLPDVLPVSLNNTQNDVGYLSLGIALQLALTANGEISLSLNYEQSGLIGINARANQETEYLVKGYDYPHPAIDRTEPDGSREQETPYITSSYKGEASFKAGVSVDVGFCILGMIPMKIANGIEMEIKAGFDSKDQDKKITTIKNSYIENRDSVQMIVNSYSDLKFHLGVKPKIGGKSAALTADSVIQLYRKNLIQIPEPIDFDITQCRIGGVQLGKVYTDDQLATAIYDFTTECSDYNFFMYTKDSAINTALDKATSAFGIKAEDYLESIELSCPNAKLDCYPSGALFVRDADNVVIGIVLFGDNFRNDAGLHKGLQTDEIESIYSVPDQKYTAKLEIGALLELFTDSNINNVDLQATVYNGTDGLCSMEIFSTSDTSQLIILETVS